MANETQWRVITPALLEELPELPGVFEIGNLVRNVLLIEAAPTGIATAIRTAMSTPRLLSRAHCVRFEVTDEGEDRARERLAEYRRDHAGCLPYAHRKDALTTMLEARRPPARALPLARPGRKAGPTSFRRASPGT